MSWTLFKSNIRTNRFIFILITIIFFFYIAIIMSIFDPEQINVMNDMIKMMPEPMIKAMNFSTFGDTLFTFISGYIYGFLVFLFPMIMVITINHRLVGTLVDKGSMAFILATPISRKNIIFTQIIFSLSSVTALFTISTLLTITLASVMFPGDLEIGKFIFLNFYTLILYFAISSICFLGSTLANESKTSLNIGVGVPVGFLVLQMLGDSSEQLHWIGNLSLYALFDPDAVTRGDQFMYLGILALLTVSIILYGISVEIFSRKNLYV